ncbi:hypothetical protein BV898_18625 [Hypsibius exemplaris]|uniref:MAGE domain-containing protein n=1 Tax=Hypsibius exemplaris TaxID=2072580 RepID=A0A9X6RN72_HYPEX|nr:hypothetical protein BV898_18625 [Hypsibius exemplaris]
MPPRGRPARGGRKAAAPSQSQRSTRSTQPEEEEQSDASVDDESEQDQEMDDESALQQPRQKKMRLDKVETPATAIKWMERGLDDLPAIPNLDGGNEEVDDSNTAALMVVAIILQNHGKLPFTNNQLKNKIQAADVRCDFELTFKAARRLLLMDFGYVLAEIRPDHPVFPIGGPSDIEGDDAEEAPAEGSGEEEEEGTQTQATQKSGRGTGRATRKKTFIIVNTMKPELSFVNCGKREFAYQRDGDPKAAAQMTVLTLTLLYIFMEGGEVSEELLWLFLKPYGFNTETTHKLITDHGGVRSLVTSQFVKQQYLVRHTTQGRNDGPELAYYRWGPRADLEFSRLAIVKLCGKVFGVEASMENFGERFNNAETTERRRLAKILSFTRNL